MKVNIFGPFFLNDSKSDLRTSTQKFGCFMGFSLFIAFLLLNIFRSFGPISEKKSKDLQFRPLVISNNFSSFRCSITLQMAAEKSFGPKFALLIL